MDDNRVASPSDITLSFGRSSSLKEIKETVKCSPAVSILQLLQCACVDDNGISELISVINPRLRGFEASNLPHITTAAIQTLSEHCRELQYVKFISCRKLNRHCLKALGNNCKKLRSVSFLKENRADDWCLDLASGGDKKGAGSALSSGILADHFKSDLDAAAFVGFDDITDATLINISKHFCSSVIDLDFSASCSITDYGLKILATKCKHLQSLALSNTFITDKGIYYLADNCRRLRTLNVSGCQNITEVGLREIVKKCSELETLTATRCSGVTDLRLFVQECHSSLQELDVRETPVLEIPQGLSEIQPNLRILYGNMCKELSSHPSSPELTNGDATCVSLADDTRAEDRDIAYRRRVLILGDAGSGKTTIVKSLCCGINGADEVSGKSKDRVDEANIRYTCPFKESSIYHTLVDHKLDDTEKSIVLEIWDCTSRRIWQQCLPLFLLQQSVCVIVFNLTDESSYKQSILQYLHSIQAKVPSSHIILVGTHRDKLNGDEDQQQDSCKDILEDIQRGMKRRREEITQEIETLKDIPGKSDKVKRKLLQLDKILDGFSTPLSIYTSSNTTTEGIDDIKKAIFKTILTTTQQNNGINTDAKQVLTKQVVSLRKENNVVVTKDTLCHVSSVKSTTDDKHSDRIRSEENHHVIGKQERRAKKNKKDAKHHGIDNSHLEKQVEYLKSIGAVIEAHQCNKTSSPEQSPSSTSSSLSSIHHHDNSTKPSTLTPSPSEEDSSHRSSSPPANPADQNLVAAGVGAPSNGISLLCVNPAALAQAIFAIHVDDTRQAFKFEANRFWPKRENVKKPNPTILVHALEELATQGLVRECLFPLLWQDLNLNEPQTQHLVDFLCCLGILVRQTLPASPEPDCQSLRLPHYSNLSTQQQYRLPLLGMLMEQGPSLNWTPKPFQGDIEITWRYEFLGGDIPDGMVTRLLAYCFNQCPEQAIYQHYWKKGVLMKMGQVYIHMSEPIDNKASHVDFTGRITTDEEGESKATQFIWVALSHFLVCAQRYISEWHGLAYKVTLLPSKTYYECSNSAALETLEVPLLLCLQMLAQDESTLSVVLEDTKCTVQLNMLLPMTGDPKLSIDEWLTWLSVQPIVWTDTSPPLDMNHNIDDETATDGGDESSLVASPKTEAKEDHQESLSSPPSKDKVVAKRKEIKWDLGGQQITEEQQVKEAKKVAATFIATILAGAMAQYIAEEIQGPGAEAAANASAQAAKAARSGEPEAAARAVVAAAQAVLGASSGGKQSGGKVNGRSRLCAII